ncbi:MarR family winged helix-turn-helix transcriptional regulator [Croceiramulus getboli]|nr:MarR family transcriptional regulator [Flavobacteriaceae bacterium YJPT1-3]
MNIEKIIKTQALPAARKTTINLLYTSSWASDLLTEALKPFDLSLQQFNVLRILRGQQGKPANLSTIQERMVSKMSNTTRLVDKLNTKQLTERIVCPTNRRKVEITITSKGLQLLKQVDLEVEKAEQKVVQRLNQQQIEQLNALLNKMRI